MEAGISNLEKIASVIKKSSKVLIFGHIMPDGDSLGSVISMGFVLSASGKKVTMVTQDPVPDNLAFLPGVDDLITGDKALDDDYDTAVILDCSVPDRMGPYKSVLDWEITTVNIDHHPGNNVPARYNYVDPEAAATGEILYDMFSQNGFTLSSQVATCLYTAIITDTGSFQYENTTPETHRRVASLLEYGLQPGELNGFIFDQKPLPFIYLLRSALQKLKLSECGRVAWTAVFQQDLEAFQARDEHTESLINYPRSIKGVEVAILFRELEPGTYKIGFRSKGKVDVNELARNLGGGGHTRASGCILNGEFKEIENNVVSAALGAVRNTDGG